jgi:uncharacterized protein YceK
MKAIIVSGLIVGFMAGCSSVPKLEGFDKPKALARTEVIQGAKDCVNAKMKPTIQYLPQKTDNGTIVLPVDVHCDVYK